MNNVNEILKEVKYYFHQRKFDYAIELLLKTKKVFKYNRQINDAILQFYFTLKKDSDAQVFIESLRHEKGYQQEYELILSDIYYHIKQYSSALEILHIQINLSSNKAALLFKCGLNYKGLDKYAEAIKYIQLALDEGYQKKIDAYFVLSALYTLLRKEDQAIRYIEKILKKESDNIHAKLDLAVLKLSAGEIKEGIQTLKDILGIDPNNLQALVRLVYASKADSRDTKALDGLASIANQANVRMVDKIRIYYAIGKIYDDLKNYENALNYFRLANNLNNKLIGAYDEKHYARKVAQIKEYVNLQPDKSALCDGQYNNIFIIGHFRSGSTLVEQIISSHSKIKSVGELDFFINKFWNNNGLQNKGDELVYSEKIRTEYEKTLHDMVGQTDYVVDKRPENVLLLGVIKQILPNAKFIYLKRTFTDNALSIYFQNLTKNVPYSNHFKSIASYDRLINDLMEHWKLLFSDSIFTIHYEDLLVNQEIKTNELLKFIGVDFEKSCISFERNKNFVNTASTMQVRNKIYLSSKGRINNYLPYLTDQEKSHLFYQEKVSSNIK